MVTEESFVKRVEQLRKLGAKYIALKTGAYRPADIARAVKFSSIAKIDYLTVDADPAIAAQSEILVKVIPADMPGAGEDILPSLPGEPFCSLTPLALLPLNCNSIS